MRPRTILAGLTALGAALAFAVGAALAQQQPPPKAPPPSQRPKAPPATKAAPPPPPAFKITIATEGGYPPFNFRDAGGQPAGFEIDLARELCKRMNAECRFVFASWDALLPGLLENKHDAVMAAMDMTAERRRNIAFTRRYMQRTAGFAAVKGLGLADAAPSLLRGKKVGAVDATMHLDYLERTYRKAIVLRRYPTIESARAALAKGEIEALLADKMEHIAWLKSAEGSCCELFGPDIRDRSFGDGVGVGLRKDDLKLREAFNKAIADAMQDGGYKKINDKYAPFPFN
jgi:ABC-type amino acid transport substrate-binding protein